MTRDKLEKISREIVEVFEREELDLNEIDKVLTVTKVAVELAHAQMSVLKKYYDAPR